MFLKGREKAYGTVLKENFSTEKIKKKIMTSFIVVIVLMSIGTTLGAIYVVLYDKAV